MNALVMYDHQTRTLWSQFLSRAVKGTLAGRELEIVPVVQTTWERWLREHPDTLALRKTGGGGIDPYLGYYVSNAAGVIGESNRDARLEPKDKVLGMGFDDGAKAFPLNVLRSKQVVNDSVAGESVVVYFEPATETALAYSRTVSGRTLTFELVVEDDGLELLRDTGTGTTWLPFTGRALDGELAGQQLARARSVVSFWFAWSDFYPETELFPDPPALTAR
jgi:hypothetical protein